jgi:hypothetical protein
MVNIPWRFDMKTRQLCHDLVKEVAAFIDRPDAHAFVQPMSSVAVGIAEYAREAIGGNARWGNLKVTAT